MAYVLVGSMAMAAQGIVRAARDIDVFVSADESNIARLRAALREVFDDPEIDRIAAADLEGEYPAIQYVPPESDYWIRFEYSDLRPYPAACADRNWEWAVCSAASTTSAIPLGTGPPVSFSFVVPATREARDRTWDDLQHASAALDEVRRQEFFRAGAVMRAHGRGKRWLQLRRWKTVRGSTRAELQALFAANRRLFKTYVLREQLDRLWTPTRRDLVCWTSCSVGSRRCAGNACQRWND